MLDSIKTFLAAQLRNDLGGVSQPAAVRERGGPVFEQLFNASANSARRESPARDVTGKQDKVQSETLPDDLGSGWQTADDALSDATETAAMLAGSGMVTEPQQTADEMQLLDISASATDAATEEETNVLVMKPQTALKLDQPLQKDEPLAQTAVKPSADSTAANAAAPSAGEGIPAQESKDAREAAVLTPTPAKEGPGETSINQNASSLHHGQDAKQDSESKIIMTAGQRPENAELPTDAPTRVGNRPDVPPSEPGPRNENRARFNRPDSGQEAATGRSNAKTEIHTNAFQVAAPEVVAAAVDKAPILNISGQGGQAPLPLAAGANAALPNDMAALSSAGDDLPPPNFDQLASRVIRWQHLGVLSGQGSVRIRLDPPELGSVQVAMQTTQNSVKIHMTVESESVRALLQNNSEKLTQSLQAHGLQTTSVEVVVQTSHSRQNEGGDYQGSQQQNHSQQNQQQDRQQDRQDDFAQWMQELQQELNFTA